MRLFIAMVMAAGFFVSGWLTRQATSDHRYITSLAARHEAEERYFNNSLDEMIQQNKAKLTKHGRQPDER